MQQRRRRRRRHRHPWVAPIIIGVLLLVTIVGILVDRWLTQPRRPAAVTTIHATATSAGLATAPAKAATATVTVGGVHQITPTAASAPTATSAVEEATGPILVPTVQPTAPLLIVQVVTPTPLAEEETLGVDNLGTGVAATATPVGEEESSRGHQSTVAAPLNFAAAQGEAALLPAPVVFVARQIPTKGTIYWDKPKGMPGVGPYSRFELAAPGYLLMLQPDGVVRTLIDGSKPTADS